MFAKLFGPDNDQVLVVLDSAQDGSPEVRVSFQPEGLGVCHVGMGFPDTDDGWDKAEQAFSGMTEERAREAVRTLRSELLSANA